MIGILNLVIILPNDCKHSNINVEYAFSSSNIYPSIAVKNVIALDMIINIAPAMSRKYTQRLIVNVSSVTEYTILIIT